MPTPLTTAIDNIIAERKQKAIFFDNKREGYQKLSETVDQIVQSINEIKSINGRNSIVQTLLGSEFLRAIDKIDGNDIKTFKDKYGELDALIHDVSTRYNKDEINISVIGKARQGKSTLLQSISNLDSTIIPAFDKNDCTGAVSILRNVPNHEVTAKVYFYTKTQMIDIINRYISMLGKGKVSLITSFNQIKLSEDELLTLKALSSDQTKKFEQLECYVKHFDTWAPLVEESERTGTYKSLVNKDEIIEYVSQYNGLEGDEAKYFYNYLAVAKVEIACAFKFPDAGRIVLRDTIGLGDDKMIGLGEALIDAITDRCDAAIIVQHPTEYRVMRTEDSELYRSLRQSCIARGLDMSKWFFYFINHTKGEQGKQNNYNRFDNYDNCLAFKEDVLKSTVNAGVFIADASNQDEVTNNLLIPMLTSLKDNLPQLDASLENQIDQKIQEIKEVFRRILSACKEAQKHIKVEYNIEALARINGQDIYKELKYKLAQLEKTYRDKSKEECRKFDEVTKYLIPGGPACKGIIPTEDEIAAILEVGGFSSDQQLICKELMSKVKNDFTKKFLELDEFLLDLVVELQSKVYDIFTTTMKFNLLLGEDALLAIKDRLVNEYLTLQHSRGNTGVTEEDATKVIEKKVLGAWFAEARNVLELNANFRGQLYDEIYTALDFMASLNLSARSFLLPRIRNCINILDPFDENFNAPYFSKDPQTAAKEIRVFIEQLFVRVQKESTRKIVDLVKEPHLFLLSAVTEFRDRILHSCVISNRDGKVTLDIVEHAWQDKIYGEKGQVIFNRDAYDASKKAKDLADKFRDISDLFAELNK